jgi:hypothetical protein
MVARRDDKGRFVARNVVDRAQSQRDHSIKPTPTVDAVTAFSLMRAGTVVRRLDPNRAWAKFHRIQDGVVQTADTAEKMVAGDWHRAQTDVASWYASTFARVAVTVVNVEVTYG